MAQKNEALYTIALNWTIIILQKPIIIHSHRRVYFSLAIHLGPPDCSKARIVNKVLPTKLKKYIRARILNK